MLLHVEQQVAAFAGRIEIHGSAKTMQVNPHVLSSEILPATTNFVRCVSVTARGNELARRNEVAVRPFAVKTQMHEASRTQSRQQRAPSGERVGQMMQDSD